MSDTSTLNDSPPLHPALAILISSTFAGLQLGCSVPFCEAYDCDDIDSMADETGESSDSGDSSGSADSSDSGTSNSTTSDDSADGADEDTGATCPEGTLACPCDMNGLCEADLSCIDGTCSQEELSPEAPQALTLTPSQVKRFDFSWAASPDAQTYQILEKLVSDGSYVNLGIETTETSCSLSNIPLPLRWGASYKIQACNDYGCSRSDPEQVGSSLKDAIGYVKASNTDAGDLFGWSIALSKDGGTLAIGAVNESSSATGIGGNSFDNSASDSGAVYIFTQSNGEWSQQAYIKASNAEEGDNFGSSVALSDDGSVLAVGASEEDSSSSNFPTNNSEPDSGAAYIFSRQGGSWAEWAYLKPASPESSDKFGTNIALSGDGATLAVGAIGEDSAATGIDGATANNDAFASGAAYIFVQEGSSWVTQAYIKASNTDTNDYFGSSLSLSEDGDTLAIGAYREGSDSTGVNGDEDNNDAASAGAVYVLHRNASNWSQQAYIKASNAEQGDQFGKSLSLSSDGDTLAVGAYEEDSATTGVNGAQSSNTSSESGAVYVFIRQGSSWTQDAYVKASNTDYGDKFGQSVALSGDGEVLVVATQHEDSGTSGIGEEQSDNSASSSGAAYFFVKDAGSWTQRTYIKAPNTSASDYFGFSLSVNQDGTSLAIGAYAEDSNAVGISGDSQDDTAPYSGAVYLY
ncbi:integrin [Pseudenhygromyxa sp. WMMC2535]|uniref:integrin n=1 Tax=Pseudenhygromyxa sp. WMMC2535 TaxID=2712867 RepID=UPI001557A72A|nr:integrin [Pseudenhygromyxa sp. WMMC2535]NVB43239.1 integrin [Pseudenhygromyxa sp. WMMC2535]